ncbi:ATP-binding cassette sub-family G member 1-like isoform X1 [Periplaneta americana]|uniref:ATP-binding cassette sub-family G member 1-like isoform X1 n=1 Tax=Periplaneta americana TaxID=6978 RepID=UPI0037E96BD6
MESELQTRKKGEIQVCPNRLTIEFRNLSYSVQEKKVSARNEQQIAILRDVSGKFRSGRLTAVLGPSGAGKSSLLNVLSGFKINGVTGCILVNGVERDLEEFGRQCCYITQDCYLMDLLTTRETLAVAASFKLNPKIGKQERNVMINDILELLGLRKAAHTRVGSLSGGEKKRLSIAQELLTNPPVMFFDEPTSGLDSSSSLQVISHLKSLAQGGRTVVCTIHQPSSRLFEMFDDLYILAEGQCLYNGAVNDMTSVFEEAGFQCPKYYNRADFAIEVACRERGANIEKLVAKNEKEAFANEKEDPDGVIGEQTTMLRPSLHTAVQVAADSLGSRYPISVWRQICVLLRRSVLCTVRDLHLAQLRLAAHVVVGLFLGGVYYGIGDEASKVPSNTACLMFFMMFLFFCNLFPFVHSFPVEKLVVMREHLNNWYSLEAYHISKLIAELPLQILCPTGFLLSAYFLTGQPPDGTRFLQFWAVYVLLAALAQSLGLVTGAAVEPQLGVFVVSIPMLIFSF